LTFGDNTNHIITESRIGRHIFTMEHNDIEKSGAQALQREESSDTDSVDARISALSPAEQKAVIRRVDIRLVLTLGFMYCVSLMDR
jgi:hypothetical protein